MHTQAVTFVEDGSEVDFPGQSTHVALSGADLYVETGQVAKCPLLIDKG